MNVRQQRIMMQRMRSAQSGLSLLELMIAMGLGVFLSWGAIQAFLSGKQTYSMQQGLSRLQENARMAQEFIGFDVRSAGSVGGASGSFIGGTPAASGCTGSGVNMLTAAAIPRAEYDFSRGVFGADNVPATANPTALNLLTPLNPVPIANSDVLVVHTSTDLGLTALNFLPNTSNNPASKGVSQTGATTYANTGLATGDIVAVSDFTRSKIFQATVAPAGANMTITWANGGASSSPPRPGNACSTWTEAYRFGWGINETTGVDYFSPEVTLKRLDTAIYYVAIDPTTNRPSLYRRLLGDGVNSVPLLEGVENLQLEFGVDINNNHIIDSWQTANNVTAAQWSYWDDLGTAGLMDAAEQNVIAVRYSLLLRTEEEVLERPQTYTYNNVPVVAVDRRLRQVVTGTIGVRGSTN